MKKKPNNAKTRALDKDWEELLAKHSKPLEKGLNGRAVAVKKTAKVTDEQVRITQRIRSLVTPGHDASVKKVMMYSGNNIVGIAQMAKSNAVPVFSKQEAIDIAKMRRG